MVFFTAASSSVSYSFNPQQRRPQLLQYYIFCLLFFLYFIVSTQLTSVLTGWLSVNSIYGPSRNNMVQIIQRRYQVHSRSPHQGKIVQLDAGMVLKSKIYNGVWRLRNTCIALNPIITFKIRSSHSYILFEMEMKIWSQGQSQQGRVRAYEQEFYIGVCIDIRYSHCDQLQIIHLSWLGST